MSQAKPRPGPPAPASASRPCSAPRCGRWAREAGTGRLEEAVEAYPAALRERTRARVQLNWAATQNNLGTALAVLGERRRDTALVEEAVRCLEGAGAVFEGAGHAPHATTARENLDRARALRVRLGGGAA